MSVKCVFYSGFYQHIENFVQVTDLIIKPNFVQSSNMSLKIMLCTRLSLDIVHIKVKSTKYFIIYAINGKEANFSSIRQTPVFRIDLWNQIKNTDYVVLLSF